MTQTETLFGLRDFARRYIGDIRHHRDVHTDHLAEAVRSFFGLPPFPTLSDLNRLCERLGIPVKRLPPAVGVDGVNIWAEATGPEIYVRDDLLLMRLETTICHEVREVLENAFKRENSEYVGLDTSNNKVMNRESDHFAACLLMQAKASRELLVQIGFDLLRFSRDTGRSLPSVVLRLQSLYSSSSGEKTPTAGIWLFDAPWPLAESGGATPETMVAKYVAQLCGFSMKRGSSSQALLARGLFPAKHSNLSDFGFGVSAIKDRKALELNLSGFDMFEEHDYKVIAEPIFSRGGPWRLLAAAVRKDGADLFAGWLARLPNRSVCSVFQSTDIPFG